MVMSFRAPPPHAMATCVVEQESRNLCRAHIPQRHPAVSLRREKLDPAEEQYHVEDTEREQPEKNRHGVRVEERSAEQDQTGGAARGRSMVNTQPVPGRLRT
jgi:hypothetical protein